ncbi:MAG: DUF6709 family protein [Coprococcus sp.]
MARTRKKGNPIVSAVVFGIFGIVLLFLGIRTFIGLHGKLLNVTTCDESEVKPGVYVEGTLTYGYGAYIEKTTTYNHTVTKTDGYYYLVDICDKNEDGSKRDTAKWIGISISKSDDAKFDAISSADDAEPIYITGVIRKNSDKVQGFLDDYITKYVDAYAQYYGYTPTSEDYATAKAEAFPYYIEMVDSSDYIFKLVLGAVFLLAAVIMILKATRSKNTISASAQPAGTGYYDGTGDFNGVYTPGSTDSPNNGNYTQQYGSTDSGSYTQQYGTTNSGSYGTAEQTQAPQTSYSDPFYSQQPAASEQDAHASNPYTTTSSTTSSSSFSLKKDE